MKSFFCAMFLMALAGEVYAGCPGGVCSLRNRETINFSTEKVIEKTFTTSETPVNEVVASEPAKVVSNCCKPVTVKNRYYRCRRCR